MTGLPVVEYTLPLKLVSEANKKEHWAVKGRRVNKQKEDTALLLRVKINPFREHFRRGALVTITRFGPKKMDTDNNTGSAKYVRDTIAKLIGVDDRYDDVVEYRVLQAIGPYKVHVRIEAREPKSQVVLDAPAVVNRGAKRRVRKTSRGEKSWASRQTG